MRNIYDNVFKNNISYFNFIDSVLDQLGFKATFKGTNYLKHLTMYIFSNNYCDIYVEQIVLDFIKNNNIPVSKRTFISNIEYAIYNTNFNKFKNNFYSIFNIEYDIYYKSTRNIVILLTNLLVKLDNNASNWKIDVIRLKNLIL